MWVSTAGGSPPRVSLASVVAPTSAIFARWLLPRHPRSLAWTGRWRAGTVPISVTPTGDSDRRGRGMEIGSSPRSSRRVGTGGEKGETSVIHRLGRMTLAVLVMIAVVAHSHASSISAPNAPAALVERAKTRNVGTLALTDHDTTAGLAEARAACAAAEIRFVPGVELSAQWRAVEVGASMTVVWPWPERA